MVGKERKEGENRREKSKPMPSAMGMKGASGQRADPLPIGLCLDQGGGRSGPVFSMIGRRGQWAQMGLGQYSATVRTLKKKRLRVLHLP